MSCLRGGASGSVVPKYEVPSNGTPGVAPFKFSPPVSTVSGDIMESWDEEFLAHKKELGELFITCASGNRYAYWIDGTGLSAKSAADDGRNEAEGKNVVCFHDGGMSKSMFICHGKVFGDTRIIAIDRLGHGGSAAEPEGEPMLFDRGVVDMLEIIDTVIGKDARIYALGHGTGGAWAIQVAAALKLRCLGVATIGAPMNPFHPMSRAQDRKRLVPGYLMSRSKRGRSRSGSSPHFNPDARRWSSSRARARVLNEATERVFPDKSQDPGFAVFYERRLKGGDGGDERAFAAMDNDPFFISKVLDSYLFGAHVPHVMLSELRRCVEPWHYAPDQIACPVHLYHGAHDRRPMMHSGSAEALSRAIGRHARCAVMREHGHISIMLEFRKILHAITTSGLVVDSSFHRSHKLMPGVSSEASAAATAVFVAEELWGHHHSHDVKEIHQTARDSLGLIHHEESEHRKREAMRSAGVEGEEETEDEPEAS